MFLQYKNLLYIRLGGVKDLNSHDTTWHAPICKKFVTAPCKGFCDSPVLLDIGENLDDTVPFASYQFWMFVFLMIASWVGMAVVVSIGDTICFGLLGKFFDFFYLYLSFNLNLFVSFGCFWLFS